MVDYPTASAVPAFRAPPSPQAIARAAQSAARALDDIFNPAPRKPELPARRAGFFKGKKSPYGLVTPWNDDFIVDGLQPAGLQDGVWTANGWTLVGDCSTHPVCCTGCNGAVGAMNRYAQYSIHAHTCCAFTPSGGVYDPYRTDFFVAPATIAVDLGRRQGGPGWKAWYLWYERPAGGPWIALPHFKTMLRWRDRTKTQASLRPAVRVTGSGRVRSKTRFEFKPRRPPGPRERQSKTRPVGPGTAALVQLLDGVLEGLEVVEALHDALPASCQSGATIATMVAAIERCYPFIDWSTALENLIDNEIEDWFFGQFGNMQKREAQSMGRLRGLNAKPATNHAGWTPCLFCN